MKKMDGKTLDIVAENIEKMKTFFPEAFTEGNVDFDVLKEVLGEYVDNRDERYSFTWNGKSKARMIAQTPSTGTLRPCPEESVDWYTTKNIFIEGDNLEVLKLLQKSYHKKVKMIYIDPPYNTGHDFVYKDDFKDNIKNYKLITGQIDGEGRNVSSNPETSGRYHTDWLNMIYPRLKLARNLLKDDGVIFISIDDNELNNLRKLCDEIYGEENFVAQLVWCKRVSPANDSQWYSSDHEYVVIYAKNKINWSPKKTLRTEDHNKYYKNPDNDPRGPWNSAAYTCNKSKSERPNLYYPITNPNTGEEIWPDEKAVWKYSKGKHEELIADNRLYWGTNGTSKSPRSKAFLTEAKPIVPRSVLPHKEVGSTQTATLELRMLFTEGSFIYPKSLGLLKKLCFQALDEEELVLDFFAGSATTAHALFELNISDSKHRKFIMVQLPEACEKNSAAYSAGFISIAEISKERIRRAADKIKENNPEYNGDLGFKVFKLDSTNIKPWEADFETLNENLLEDYISNIKTGRTESDILYEILLKYGLDLTLPIKEHTLAGQKVFDIGMGALIICLSDAVDLNVVEGIAGLKDELKPEIMRVVFKDSGFADDVVKTNAVQILKQAGIEDVRSL